MVDRGETSMGGRNARMPTTVWGLIDALRTAAPEEAREELGRFLMPYWKPIYRWFRSHASVTNEEAKDLTQEFIARFIQTDTLHDVDSVRGSFRAYLKACMRNFVLCWQRDRKRIKRGGGALHLPLHELDDDNVVARHDPPADPDASFDLEWRQTILNAGIEELRSVLTVTERKAYFDLFQSYYLESHAEAVDDPGADKAGAEPGYRELAERLGLQLHDVRNRLATCRKLLKEILRREVSRYLAPGARVEEELDFLRGA